tara:strand:+ start:13503 stop:14297 length:795 start_codon:yes stop_codon:yes gene_type:complete
MINKESIILLKTWVHEGLIFYDEYSYTYMLEKKISQAESEFYLVAPELTGLFITLNSENKARYSFCYGQLAVNNTKPILFDPKPAKLYKIISCSYYNHEHHKINLLSAIAFASFQYGEGLEGGFSCLSASLSIAKTLNQIGNISDENTLMAAVLKNVVDNTFVKTESIEMLFGKYVRKVIEMLFDINNYEDTHHEAILNKLDKASDDVKHIHLVNLSGKLKHITKLDEKNKYVSLSWNDQQARVCESASSSLYHWYMVERSGLD